jgi:hypothetical protein
MGTALSERRISSTTCAFRRGDRVTCQVPRCTPGPLHADFRGFGSPTKASVVHRRAVCGPIPPRFAASPWSRTLCEWQGAARTERLAAPSARTGFEGLECRMTAVEGGRFWRGAAPAMVPSVKPQLCSGCSRSPSLGRPSTRSPQKRMAGVGAATTSKAGLARAAREESHVPRRARGGSLPLRHRGAGRGWGRRGLARIDRLEPGACTRLKESSTASAL